MIVHVVSWKFAPGLTEEQRAEVGAEAVARLNALDGTVPSAREVRAFCPPEDGSTCDLVNYVVADTMDDLAAYSRHPDHMAVVPFVEENFVDHYTVNIEL